jgi:hypothetical protein
MKKVKEGKSVADQREFNIKKQVRNSTFIAKSLPRWRVTGISL